MLLGAVAASIGWAAVLPDQPPADKLPCNTVYYGGLECCRAYDTEANELLLAEPLEDGGK
jgi:hypothetical protein